MHELVRRTIVRRIKLCTERYYILYSIQLTIVYEIVGYLTEVKSIDLPDKLVNKLKLYGSVESFSKTLDFSA